MTETLEQIKARAEKIIPGACLAIISNGSPSAQHSLLVDNDHALAVAKLLREDRLLRLDYASNVTAVDWPDTVVKTVTKVKQVIDGVEKEVDQSVETRKPGFLEVVYHLYSITQKHGPVIIKHVPGK